MNENETPKTEKPVEVKKLTLDPPTKLVEPPPPKKTRNRTILWLTLGLVVLALAWFCYWFFYLQYHQFTDDAYANGNMVNINTAIPGSVVAFYADNTDFVTEGMLLVQLDRTPYQVAYDKELATLANTALEVSELYNRVLANQAIVQSRQISFGRAQYDYNNRASLLSSKAIANEDIAHAKDDLNIAQSSLVQAQQELQIALDARGPTIPKEHAKIIEQKNKVLTAFYQLQHTSIYAPATGYVAQRAVEVGAWVTAGSNMMAIIPTDYVWVDANFKETQLTYMRIGQPTTVWFDLYGSDVIYRGKVLGIASGSGSVFSIIPPQNATGNWIKIVQRLPVRISLDPEMVKKYPTRLGISAEVDVNITNQDLPLLAQAAPATRPVSKTEVFKLDFSKVHELMDKIVQDNLGSAQ